MAANTEEARISGGWDKQDAKKKEREREIRRQKYMVPINTHTWIRKQMVKRNLSDQINCKRGREGF